MDSRPFVQTPTGPAGPVTAYVIRPRWYYPLVAASWLAIGGAVVYHEIATARGERWHLNAEGTAAIDTRTGTICMAGGSCYRPALTPPGDSLAKR